MAIDIWWYEARKQWCVRQGLLSDNQLKGVDCLHEAVLKIGQVMTERRGDLKRDEAVSSGEEAIRRVLRNRQSTARRDLPLRR